MLNIHHAVSSMAKYDREACRLHSDADNATTVIGKVVAGRPTGFAKALGSDMFADFNMVM